MESEGIWIPGDRNLLDGQPRSFSQGVRNFFEGRPRSFFHNHVRHLCLDLSAAVFLDDIVLLACDATVNVHLSGGNSELLPHLAKLPLRRLSLDLKYLFHHSPDFTHPLFATITHLRLNNPNCLWPQLSSLAQMPCLTHLSFDGILLEVASYCNALRDCKSLQVLATSWSKVEVVEALVHIDAYAAVATDLRFVVLLATHRIRDWEMGARGGANYWVRADELVRKRRSGETTGKSLVPSVAEHTVIIPVAPEYYLLND
jgi:hypothetical protein